MSIAKQAADAALPDQIANWAPGTICIHAGAQDDGGGSITTPIYTSVATVWPNPKNQHIYPRYNTGPNVEVVSARIAALEGGEAGIVFASGMAAISSVLFTFLKNGDHCVMSEVYGGTYEIGAKDFPRQGIKNTFVLTGKLEDFEAAVKPETRVLYLESPSNPLISVLDMEAIIKMARKKCGDNLIVVTDNTFATPMNTQPLKLGVDVVIHAATKFLNGHSDLQAGVAISSKAHIETVRGNIIMYGGGLNAFDAYQLERGLMTFDLRMKAHNSNGLKLAEFLEGHPRVARVLYPHLPSHPNYEVAKRQMKGGGAMLTFDLGGDITPTGEIANKFMAALKLVTGARSLGGCHTTVCLPAETSHARLTEEERAAVGIGEGTMRISVGIEDIVDIIADFNGAFASL
jgi:cystathionine beta-lyase